MQMISSRPQDHSEVISEWASLHLKNPISFQTFGMQILAASQYRSPSKIGVPSAFVVCENDRMVSPNCGKRLAAKFSSVVYSNPIAGHDIALDDPDWLIESISDFLDKNNLK